VYVASERIIAVGRVAGTVCVGIERRASGRVAPSGSVAIKRLKPRGGVLETGGIAIERLKTNGGVVRASCVAIECIRTVGRVVLAG
jgi:hypothetical protein